MSLAGKLVHSVEIKTSAEKYYKFIKDQIYHVPNLIPSVQAVSVHDGHWDNHGHGSIKIWKYTIDGKPEVFKERVAFDDEKLVMTLTGLEGDLFKHYKTYKVTFQVVRKGPEHSLVVVTLEYEKHNPTSSDPHKYLDLMISAASNIESHLK